MPVGAVYVEPPILPVFTVSAGSKHRMQASSSAQAPFQTGRIRLRWRNRQSPLHCVRPLQQWPLRSLSMKSAPPHRIPLSSPDIHADDVELVARVLRSNRLSIGPFIKELERDFADYIGTKHAVAVTNGTSGLHLCICAAGIAEGDEVITTPFSFIASANCILYERATPVFVDIDEASLNLDPAQVARAVTGRTRAMLP